MGEVPDKGEGAFYEVKFHDPNGVVFDISAHGWVGASKEGPRPEALKQSKVAAG